MGFARSLAEFIANNMNREKYVKEFIRRIQNSSNEWIAKTICEDPSADRLRFVKRSGGLAFAVDTFTDETKQPRVGGDVDVYNTLEISKLWLEIKRNFIRKVSEEFMTQEESLLSQARYDDSLAEAHKICAYRDGEEFGLTEYGSKRAGSCAGGYTGCDGEVTPLVEVVSGVTITTPFCANCLAIKRGTRELYE